MKCTVFYDSWQMECCGTPFSVGDIVKWLVLKAEQLNTPVMGINSFHLLPFCGRFFKYFLVGFSSGTSRIAGFGEGTPQQDLPKGQNRRYADFGTVVESCSEKLRRSPAPVLSANKTFQKGFATRYSGLS